jgi:hypothetical protein
VAYLLVLALLFVNDRLLLAMLLNDLLLLIFEVFSCNGGDLDLDLIDLDLDLVRRLLPPFAAKTANVAGDDCDPPAAVEQRL